jgi:hypothetical protein
VSREIVIAAGYRNTRSARRGRMFTGVVRGAAIARFAATTKPATALTNMHLHAAVNAFHRATRTYQQFPRRGLRI